MWKIKPTTTMSFAFKINLVSESEIKITKFGPIYYEYGSMVITFHDSESACYAYEILKTCKYEEKEKNLLGESRMTIYYSN